MAESTAFSTAAEDPLTRTIDVRPDDTAAQLSDEAFDEYYDISATAQWISMGGYKKVALQFPDELLHDSVPIFRRLKAKISSPEEYELYVLADTSYGSCCVDEVTAEHVSATAMVHYGNACMSQTSRLPIMYVFGKRPVDVERCVDIVSQSLPVDVDLLTLKHDVAYSHVAELIAISLKSPSRDVLYTPIPRRTQPSLTPNSTKSNTPSSLPVTILYIGGESLGLTNILMTHSSTSVYSYNPTTSLFRLESLSTNRMLMRRYAVVQKARDADVFGILVGTLGVASYLPLIKRLRALLASKHKKSYTISVGKLNPAKLANFMEVECWVLVACPENSIVDVGRKDFYRPIVTPFELGVALETEPTWTGRYVLDFEQFLEEQKLEVVDESSEGNTEGREMETKVEADGDQPAFSLISGTYRHAKRYGVPAKDTTGPESDSQALMVRDYEGTLVKLPDSAAGDYLTNRVYRGLEQRLGQDAPGVLEQGRTGVASGYDDDH